MSFDARRLYALLPAVYRTPRRRAGRAAARAPRGHRRAGRGRRGEHRAALRRPVHRDLRRVGGALHRRPDRRARPRPRRRRSAPFSAARRGRQHASATAGARARPRCSSSSRATSPAGRRVAVEFFELLATTQYMNHVRAPTLAATADRAPRAELLERVDTALRPARAHLRRPAHRQRARPLQHPERRPLPLPARRLPLTEADAVRLDDFRYIFNPLGIDTPLFNRPRAEDDAHAPGRALERAGARISRLEMQADRALSTAGARASSCAPGQRIAAGDVVVCDLSDLPDASGDWAHTRRQPVRRSTRCSAGSPPDDATAPAPTRARHLPLRVHATTIGGGEYDAPRVRPGTPGHASASNGRSRPPGHASAPGALAGGAIEIGDSRTYALNSAAPNLAAAAGCARDARQERCAPRH